MLRVLDLFSGIGGFSLGLERTGGFKTVAFCEIDPFARRVLAKNWPEVPCYEDVRTLTAERLAADGLDGVDVICGGFPCQDISDAGRKSGIDGDRSRLWFEYARLIGDIRPRYAIIENSHALRGRGLDRVLNGLADLGYDAEWSVVTACAVGYAHVRKRLYLVAYPSGQWREQRGRLQFTEGRDQARDVYQRLHQPEPPRVAHGLPDRVDRNYALGNAVVPDIPELIGRALLADRAAASFR